MKKLFKGLSIFVCVCLLVLSVPVSAYATTDDELKEQKKNIDKSKEELDNAQTEKEEMQETISGLEDEKEELEEAKQDLSDYVVQLDGQLISIQDKLNELELRIAEKQVEVDNINEQLRQAEETEANQYASMKMRIKFMYEKGDQSYTSLVFGAENFSDMLNKAEYVEEISRYDREMLLEYQNTKEAIAMLKDQLEFEKAELANAKEEALSKEGEMEDLIDKKNNQILEYESDISNKEKVIAEYEAELAAQTATIAALEQQIAAAEADLREKDVSGNYIDPLPSTPTYSGGGFCWPAPSYTKISSEFGYRIHPILNVQQYHSGLDMAAPGGSPILAASDGVVVASSYNNTMGNYIMINHGGGLYTVYMHASALYVSAGQTVSKGQRIAAVGTTGRSTGNHLHFSVRLNGSYVNPWNYL